MSFEGCCAIFVFETRDVIMTKVVVDWYRVLYISINSKIEAKAAFELGENGFRKCFSVNKGIWVRMENTFSGNGF